MSPPPIRIPCEGSDHPAYTVAGNNGLCVMCGSIVTCRVDGTTYPHDRNDILAMLERGDFNGIGGRSMKPETGDEQESDDAGSDAFCIGIFICPVCEAVIEGDRPCPHGPHGDGFDDSALWHDVGPWHCGLCGENTTGCECGEPLVLIVRVPGLTHAETDHDLVAMSLVAMLNESRVEQYGGPEGDGPTPIRLLASGWDNVPAEIYADAMTSGLSHAEAQEEAWPSQFRGDL